MVGIDRHGYNEGPCLLEASLIDIHKKPRSFRVVRSILLSSCIIMSHR